MNANNRILLLVQTHAHAAALMGCIPHIRAHYEWVWVVYSPAVLADPALVEKEFDGQIADLTRAMKDCYGREDGAGGDAYKAKRDAAILEKSAKVKDAWKSLPEEQKVTTVNRIFRPFYDELKTTTPGISVSIMEAADHFETAAHVEFQNSLKAGMKTGFVPGEYVIGWPTSLPKGEMLASGAGQKPSIDAASKVVDTTPVASVLTTPPTIKIDKRTKEYKSRLKELQLMSLDDLGPIAFELGIKPNDPVAGKQEELIEKIIELEQARDVSAY